MPLKSLLEAPAGCLPGDCLYRRRLAPTLTVASVPTVKAQKGSVAAVTFRAVLPPGFHANSNTPTDAYLIPLTLKWTGGPLQADGITYPKALAGEVFVFRQAALGGDRRIQHLDEIQGARQCAARAPPRKTARSGIRPATTACVSRRRRCR